MKSLTIITLFVMHVCTQQLQFSTKSFQSHKRLTSVNDLAVFVHNFCKSGLDVPVCVRQTNTNITGMVYPFISLQQLSSLEIKHYMHCTSRDAFKCIYPHPLPLQSLPLYFCLIFLPGAYLSDFDFSFTIAKKDLVNSKRIAIM